MKACGLAVLKACCAALLAVAALLPGIAGAADAQRSPPAAALYARYLTLAPELEQNQFARPLHLDSTQTGSGLTGEVGAVVAQPFAQVQAGLKLPANWCKLLMLHVNSQSCRVVAAPAGTMIKVGMGHKTVGPLEQVYQLEFDYQVAAASADYFEVTLRADDGPLATHDYRLSFAATPLAGDKTFLRLRYAYGYGFAGRLAMQGYLATVGRNKVGFTLVGTSADGQPQYIGGMRGVIERNSMRYYLAIDVHLNSLAVPPAQQFEYAINGWFDAIERYPRQLHELDRAVYLAKKRGELERDRAGP